MRKFWVFGRKKHRRNDSSRPLIDNMNIDTTEGYNQTITPPDCTSMEENTLSTKERQCVEDTEEIGLRELAELLGVASDEASCRSITDVCLVQKSVELHFPMPSAGLSLQQYLSIVQETVLKELVRLAPVLQSKGLMGYLIDGYHRQTFAHLRHLLQSSRSANDSFVLMKWVLHTYLSQELLNHPDIQDVDPIKEVDCLLFTEWITEASANLLENVREDVSVSLEKILHNERSRTHCDPEEALVRLYTDTIQYLNAVIAAANQISSRLSDLVKEVCFQELLTFLRRYKAEQTEILGKITKMDQLEMMHFFKTLNNCKELKRHVENKGKGIEKSLFTEIIVLLEDMDTSTMKLLMEIVADVAQHHLKSYFKTSWGQNLVLDTVTTLFPKQTPCPDLQKRVMNEAYKLIAHIYLKHLLRSKLSKLQRSWGVDVGETITSDAKRLHTAMSDLAPGVQQCNLMLLNISELLDCSSTDAVKITLAHVQQQSPTWRLDQELLPALLRWKGLSGWKVREVLDALPRQEPPSVSCYSWLSCLWELSHG